MEQFLNAIVLVVALVIVALVVDGAALFLFHVHWEFLPTCAVIALILVSLIVLNEFLAK